MPLTGDQIIARSVNNLIEEPGQVSQVVIRRPVREKNERGGYSTTSVETLDPQSVRFVPFKRRLTLEHRDGPTDRTTLVEYILTGPLGTDVQEGDELDYEGEVWRVNRVSALRFHRVQATIARRGEKVT